ncbi:hypothetical protein Pmani_032021 [Petrolisthes manimaculis]|uniref:Uncharacterized protein n=1 Tax=Petrolisthes manimaculis TaxID=1843537 RepID=A0AAE1NTV5_9EUCA|nr:hypothetical protein Pmani_032021 [Petrolisthes manimaculis]
MVLENSPPDVLCWGLGRIISEGADGVVMYVNGSGVPIWSLSLYITPPDTTHGPQHQPTNQHHNDQKEKKKAGLEEEEVVFKG